MAQAIQIALFLPLPPVLSTLEPLLEECSDALLSSFPKPVGNTLRQIRDTDQSFPSDLTPLRRASACRLYLLHNHRNQPHDSELKNTVEAGFWFLRQSRRAARPDPADLAGRADNVLLLTALPIRARGEGRRNRIAYSSLLRIHRFKPAI